MRLRGGSDVENGVVLIGGFVFDDRKKVLGF